MNSLTSYLKARWILALSSCFLMIVSCQKETKQVSPNEEIATAANNNNGHGHLNQTKEFSADVVIRWLNMQLDMLRVPLAAGTGSQAAERALAYCGIATYESVEPGMPAYQTLTNQLNDFPVMPSTEPGKAYHWAASANAALAEMNRRLFPTTSAVNKTNIDNLENELKAIYANEVDAATLQRSIAFGKEVATRVFAWAAVDGSANVNPPYVPTPNFVGPAFWVQSVGPGTTLNTTPPNNPQAANPYAYQRRLLVPDVTNGTALEPPPAYSTDPASPFYAMVKDVYDKSQNLTPAQTAMAIYHRDAPGYPGGGHFVAILAQVLTKAETTLDIAALSYAKVGIGAHDAILICFVNKYTYNLVRPINYIRNVMQHGTWNALFNTPGHPEFPSAHAVFGTAVAAMLTDVLGDNFQFTLHTYDYLGLPARSYNSFFEMSKEMADSRVFAGIHYQASCDKGRWLGEKIAENVLSKVKFLKE
jgi:hypothetical protein